MVERFQVGEIAGAHGVRGDVKVFPTTDDPARFRKLKTVYIEQKNGVMKQTTASNARFVGKFVVIHLDGVNTMDEARALMHRALWVDRKDAIKLPKGRFFIADLIGIRVIDENEEELGTFKDVLKTGANDVYVVERPDGKELMIPAIKDCILETNPEEGFMRVRLLPGLMDL